MAIRYALTCCAIDERNAAKLRERVRRAFLNTVTAQSRRVSEESPDRRFLCILAAVLSSGAAAITSDGLLSRGDAPHVGWYDAQYLYLQPQAARKAVVEFCQKLSDPFHTRDSVLRKSLLKSGVLECSDNGEHTRVVRIGRGLQRVLQLRRDKAEALAGESFPGSPKRD